MIIGIVLVLVIGGLIIFKMKSKSVSTLVNPLNKKDISESALTNPIQYNFTQLSSKVDSNVSSNGSLIISKFGGQVSLELELPDVIDDKTKTIDTSNPDIKTYADTKSQVNYYEKNMSDNSSAFEYEIILKDAPIKNRISIPIKTKNIAFLYQPPLNEETQPKGYTCNATSCTDESGEIVKTRPEEIVGSYSLMAKNLKNNQYGTGQIAVIYRPFVEDAKGERVWADLYINDSVMTITIPQDFLDKAVYPVIIDPTFGYTTLFGSENGYYTTGDALIGGAFTLSEDGDVISIELGGRADTNIAYIKGVIFDDDGAGGEAGTILGTSTEKALNSDVNQFWNCTFATPVSLSAGNYWLGFFISRVDSGGKMAVNYQTGGNNIRADLSYGTTPVNWDASGDTEYNGYSMSVYAEYSPSGGGGDTCTYTSGNWFIEGSDNCVISSPVDLSGNNVTINGTGSLTGITNINNAKVITAISRGGNLVVT